MQTTPVTPSPPSTPKSALTAICNIILDESCSQQSAQNALDDFSSLCSQVTGITPNPSFDAWAEDTFLEQGVAINPQAAAYCIKDYQRSITFIRAVHAAITAMINNSPTVPVDVLYAGCGPFATLLIPLLSKYQNENTDLSLLNFFLLDIHQTSLESVDRLVRYFDINTHNINLISANACTYQHPRPLQLIISETMQKSLEQEPQFTITANLAPQLESKGIFIPEKIVVKLCLAQWKKERDLVEQHVKIDHQKLVGLGKRFPLETILTLDPILASSQLNHAKIHPNTNKLALEPVDFQIPALKHLEEFDLLFLTNIEVFKHYQLNDYESEITLPSRYQSLSSLKPGKQYKISYQLGNYPEFYIWEE